LSEARENIPARAGEETWEKDACWDVKDDLAGKRRLERRRSGEALIARDLGTAFATEQPGDLGLREPNAFSKTAQVIGKDGVRHDRKCR
jgi:hypothetical protein